MWLILHVVNPCIVTYLPFFPPLLVLHYYTLHRNGSGISVVEHEVKDEHLKASGSFIPLEAP